MLLLSLLINSDLPCCCFVYWCRCSYLEDLRQSEATRSVWLFHNAAQVIYEQARRRVYMVVAASHAVAAGGSAAAMPGKASAGGRKRKQPDKSAPQQQEQQQQAHGAASHNDVSSDQPSRGTKVVPVLEEPPKWDLLVQVLNELQQQRKRAKVMADTGVAEAVVAAAPAVAPLAAATAGGSGGVHLQHPEGSAGHVANAHQQPGTHSGGGGDHAGVAARKGSAWVEVVDLLDSTSSDDDVVAVEEPPGIIPQPYSSDQQFSKPEQQQQQQQDLKDVAGGASSGIPVLLSASEREALATAACAPVLVVVRELHMVKQLQEVVSKGGGVVMQQLYEGYLRSKLAVGGRRPRAAGGAAGSSKASAVARGRGGTRRGRGRFGRDKEKDRWVAGWELDNYAGLAHVLYMFQDSLLLSALVSAVSGHLY